MKTPASTVHMTLDALLERFTNEVRSGKAPSVAEYARKCPALAKEIEELFPLIEGLEKCKVAQDADFVRQNFPEEFPLRQLGDCTLIREIGRGGMGLVFEAIQGPVGHAVAIKLLPTKSFVDRLKSKERFQSEAITIAQLRHQNIVPIYSFGEDQGYYFYVMQLIRGVSLDWVIRELRASPEPICPLRIQEKAGGGTGTDSDPARPVAMTSGRKLSRRSWNIFAKIGIQVAMGISHAHEHKILHHDIKPANLLLNASGRVLVTDFGGSYQPSSTVGATAEHQTGTLRYMAPERLRGLSDARSDVYSIGVTLYELATQQPTFEASDRSRLVEKILDADVILPRRIRPEIPVEFERIILKAAARNPDARYASARALAEDLQRFVKRDKEV